MEKGIGNFHKISCYQMTEIDNIISTRVRGSANSDKIFVRNIYLMRHQMLYLMGTVRLSLIVCKNMCASYRLQLSG